MAEYVEEKKQLRAEMKRILSKLTPDEIREKSAVILARLFKLKGYRRAKTVLAYASFREEVQTDALIAKVLQDGKRLVLPRLNPFDNSLVPHEVSDPQTELLENKFGIREPRPDLPVVPMKEIEIIAVPGLAFNEFGDRLGRGMGCYDRLIFNGVRKNKFIALAFDCQITGDWDIPHGFEDYPVDLILTESRKIDPADAADEFYDANKEFMDKFAEELGVDPKEL
ncbi:MAG TPA: 5-formyltetrahydrofolate cyclo-ligase [Planctomycetota bacterium]|nr:5-formyltetrahydrofolate cyclo-ligase [Planctomycetota bacterium]